MLARLSTLVAAALAGVGGQEVLTLEHPRARKTILAQPVTVREEDGGGVLLLFTEGPAALARHDFLRAFAHDLRSPVQAIQGFAELIGDPDLEAPRREDYAHRIQAAGDQLLALIAQVVELSALSAGQWTGAEPEGAVVLAPLVTLAVEALGPAIAAKKNELELHLPVEPLTLRGDRALLTKAVHALLENANRFTRGGEITLTLERRSDGDVALGVKDSGLGLSPAERDHLNHIFERSPAARGLGAGLGLAFVQQVAARHEGVLNITSEAGLGTNAVLVLPAARCLG